MLRILMIHCTDGCDLSNKWGSDLMVSWPENINTLGFKSQPRYMCKRCFVLHIVWYCMFLRSLGPFSPDPVCWKESIKQPDLTPDCQFRLFLAQHFSNLCFWWWMMIFLTEGRWWLKKNCKNRNVDNTNNKQPIVFLRIEMSCFRRLRV